MTGRENSDEEHQDQDSEPSLKAPGDVAPTGYAASQDSAEDENEDSADDSTQGSGR